MRITKTHHDDRSEPDAAGMYEWIYTYGELVFADDSVSLTFRHYTDTPTEASLLSYPGWTHIAMHMDILARSLEYLREEEGVSKVRVLDSKLGRYVTLLESISVATALSASERARLRSVVRDFELPNPALQPTPQSRRG